MEDAETVRDGVGEEAAAVAEAVPVAEDQQTNKRNGDTTRVNRTVTFNDDTSRVYRTVTVNDFEEAEQDEYRRYRIRGGEKRFRPSDIGDEDIYRTLNLPLSKGATDGCYLDDHEHISPTVDRLISWDYRQSIRPWYNNLSPPANKLSRIGAALAPQLVTNT